MIKGLYYDGWDPSGKPEKISKEEFLSRINSFFVRTNEDIDAESLTKSILSVIANRASADEMINIKNVLPKEFEDLFHVEIVK